MVSHASLTDTPASKAASSFFCTRGVTFGGLFPPCVRRITAPPPCFSKILRSSRSPLGATSNASASRSRCTRSPCASTTSISFRAAWSFFPKLPISVPRTKTCFSPPASTTHPPPPNHFASFGRSSSSASSSVVSIAAVIDISHPTRSPRPAFRQAMADSGGAPSPRISIVLGHPFAASHEVWGPVGSNDELYSGGAMDSEARETCSGKSGRWWRVRVGPAAVGRERTPGNDRRELLSHRGPPAKQMHHEVS